LDSVAASRRVLLVGRMRPHEGCDAPRMRGKRDFESRLDDLVQQRDRSSVSGEPVGLELGIPRRTKEILQAWA
jgi:hypothetical protein